MPSMIGVIQKKTIESTDVCTHEHNGENWFVYSGSSPEETHSLNNDCTKNVGIKKVQEENNPEVYKCRIYVLSIIFETSVFDRMKII